LAHDESDADRSLRFAFRSFTDLREPPAGELKPTDLNGLPTDGLVEWLEAMLLIREFEAACEPLVLDGKIPGGMHSSAGQEAVAVGATRALLPTDIVASSHRSHHVSLSKGLTPASVMAELYGKATGCARGRGGHMHLSDFSLGLFGSNGIVGGGVGIALGASLASKLREVDQVAVGFFGDGGASTGRVWEFVNLATIWRLPLIVICENNLYAVETFVGRVAGGNSIADRAAAFGISTQQVDGQDVGAMYRAVSTARQRAVSGGGPTFIEALTYRFRGHNTGDSETYRERSEVQQWEHVMDPIRRLERALVDAGVLPQDRLAALIEEVRGEVAAAVAFAEESPWPDVSTAIADVTALPMGRRTHP
jgi:pyruvate dehydrogenase E1 component alpha subunit